MLGREGKEGEIQRTLRLTHHFRFLSSREAAGKAEPARLCCETPPASPAPQLQQRQHPPAPQLQPSHPNSQQLWPGQGLSLGDKRNTTKTPVNNSPRGTDHWVNIAKKVAPWTSLALYQHHRKAKERQNGRRKKEKRI